MQKIFVCWSNVCQRVEFLHLPKVCLDGHAFYVHFAHARAPLFCEFFPPSAGKKKPGAGKKNPAPGKKNPAPESTMDQNRKIPRNSSKLDTIWVVARDEATKEIGHEHIIFPREDRGFRSNYEKIDL